MLPGVSRERGSLITGAALRVARHVLEGEFGPIVAEIATWLLANGAAPWVELLREFQPRVSKAHVRCSLLVLIQHNIVRCTEKSESAVASKKRMAMAAVAAPVALYEASLDEIFVRPCFPGMLKMARKRFGADAVLLLQQVMACGRLTGEQLVERACEMHAAGITSASADSQALAERRQALHAAYMRLRAAHFLSRVRGLTGGLADAAAAAAAAEDAAAAAAAAEPAPEPSLPEPTSGRKRKGSGASTSVPAPALRHPGGALGARASAEAARTEEEALWRVHVLKFLLELKHAAVEELVSDKFDRAAGEIVHRALRLESVASVAHPEREASFDELFTVEDVLGALGTRFEESDQPVSAQLVCNYLDTLCADPVLTVAASLNGKYVLKLPELLSALKQLLLEQVVAAKLGEPGGRLYRILLRHHANGGCASRGQQKLELKQLAEQALLPERDARPLLLRLLQDEYVFLQEVPRTADRNPKTTFYLWYVSLPHALRTLESEILRTLHHLYGRLAHETKLARGGQAAAAAVAAGSASRAVPELGGETSRQQVLDAQRRTDYLEAAILKLHKTLLILRLQHTN